MTEIQHKYKTNVKLKLLVHVEMICSLWDVGHIILSGCVSDNHCFLHLFSISTIIACRFKENIGRWLCSACLPCPKASGCHDRRLHTDPCPPAHELQLPGFLSQATVKTALLGERRAG